MVVFVSHLLDSPEGYDGQPTADGGNYSEQVSESGICAALLASGVYSCNAAALAVHLHGRAGELLARKSPLGHLAGEIANTLPLVWKELCAQ